MIKITVLNKDPEMAKKIAETIGYEFSKEVESLYKISNLGLVDEALVPTTASNESNKKEMILINGGALAGSLMIIFMLFYFDNTIKDQEQVQEKTNLPVLGNVPLVSKKKDSKEKDLIVHNDPKSPISEGLRTIRTNLQFSNVDKQMKKQERKTRYHISWNLLLTALIQMQTESCIQVKECRLLWYLCQSNTCTRLLKLQIWTT